MPSAGRALGERERNGRAAEADAADPRRVLGREVGMVEEAREEHRRARARTDVGVEHDLEHARRVPAVDQVDVLRPASIGAEHRAEHAGRVRDRRTHEVGRTGRDPRPHVHELGEQRAVAVHHALRVARRARRVGEHAHVVGVGRRRSRRPAAASATTSHATRRTRAVASPSATAPTTTCSVELGQLVGPGAVDDVEIVDVAVAVGGDVARAPGSARG